MGTGVVGAKLIEDAPISWFALYFVCVACGLTSCGAELADI